MIENIVFVSTLALTSVLVCATVDQPNIVMVVLDDVGWADLSYNVGGGGSEGSIPTPNIDALAGAGVRLRSHYVHPSCTPSRAALMTGRYAHNTGLSFAMFPGSVAGLPPDMATLPQLLREAGYAAHMVGKWHLGHAQWAQTPVGRGFQSHVGSLMWDLESYTKQIWRGPLQSLGRDWGRYHENRSYEHFLEPRHATLALTDEAATRMTRHRAEAGHQPLFLYVSYTAAHSPLQPEPEWEAECGHIPHLWRRQFCGMVVGLDRALATLADTARAQLGDNTVLVVTSDNGGSTWFGGLNAPLRSGKLTPFEGGVRVPAFVVDFSGRYSRPGDLGHLVHISDWLPTFLSWAGASHLAADKDLDGLDQSEALKSGKLVRRDVVLEMVTKNDSHDGSESVAYRNGRFKIVQGTFRDPHWYSEPDSDKVATSDDSWLPRILEVIVRIAEWMFGNGPTDLQPHGLLLNVVLFNQYIKRQAGVKTWLFDLENDPNETTDLAPSKPHHKILRSMFLALQDIKHGRKVRAHDYWLTNPNWDAPDWEGFLDGDCSAEDSRWRGDVCKFAFPWLEDDVDLFDNEALGLTNPLDNAHKTLMLYGLIVLVLTLLLVISVTCCLCKILFPSRKANEKSKKA